MTRYAHALVVCLIASLALAVSLQADAQVAESTHRLKKLYDFEDTDDRGNKIGFSDELLPRNWYVVGREALGEKPEFHKIALHQSLESRAGYPHYAQVGFDRSQKFSGDFSLKLSVSGGRTGAFVQHAAITITSGSDYRVSTQVHTRNLRHAWAELRAYFIDKHGRIIEDSLRRSDPITADAGWSLASVKLTGDYPDAAYVGIELHVIQPGMDADNPIGDHQVVPSDINGAAWFDDVSVWELPSVSLSTDSRTNIISAPDRPVLHARVRDLTGQRMRAVLTVYDHQYNQVARIEDNIDKEGWSWRPDLGDRFGWYIAELEIYEVNRNNTPTLQVARTLAGFLWLGEGVAIGSEDRSRFNLIAEDVPTDQLPLLAELMHQSGLTALVVSGWERNGTPQSTAERVRQLEPLVRDLLIRQGKVAVSFWPVPVELAGRIGVDANDPLNTLTTPADRWIDFAKPFLSPLGQRQVNWQVGSSSYPHAFLARNLVTDLEEARKGIRTAAPSPHLVVPWRLDQRSRSGELAPSDTYAVAWPQGITPDQLAASMADWPTPPTGTRLDIELADASDQSHPRRIADLMLRVLHAWEHEAGGVSLTRPWTLASERRTAFMPDPVLGVYINLARQLGGQRVIGRMPLAPGLHAMILDGRQGGMLAIWNDNAEQEPVQLKLYLGPDPVAVDPFGNTTKLPNDNGKQIITVGSTPTLIRGIDPRLALFRAGFSLDEPFIDSLQVAHRRTLRIHNPWPRTLNGVYTITGPDGWSIQPQRKHLAIAPGDTVEVPVAIRFPVHEDGGHKPLTADLVFNVGEDYQVTLYAPMVLGLRGVDFDASVIVEPGEEPGTQDAIVTLTVTNTSDQRRSLNLFASIQGHMRRELILPGIEPGEFVSRQLRFKNVGDQVGQFPLRCGVRESNGPAVLNKTLELLGPKEVKDEPSLVEAPAP